MRTRVRLAAGAACALVLTGSACAARPGSAEGVPPAPAADQTPASPAPTPTPARTSSATVRASPTAAPSAKPPATPSAARKPSPSPTRLAAPTRIVRTVRLSIPALGLDDLRVRPYRGSPDDGPGTRIQNRGIAASPYGKGGGIGPGQIGNYIVTGHRTSHGAPFGDLPDLDRGARVRVTAAGTTFVYEVTDTRRTSFRSQASLARQSAPVPGHPGRRATQAMITLSTCATPEDHAAGNFWSDEFDNPEHRIDKIGVLVAIRPA